MQDSRATPSSPYYLINNQDKQTMADFGLIRSNKEDAQNHPEIMSIPDSSNKLNVESCLNMKKNSNRINNNSPSNSLYSIKSNFIRYNRRNNPELERRRTHHCDFLGMRWLIVFRPCNFVDFSEESQVNIKKKNYI